MKFRLTGPSEEIVRRLADKDGVDPGEVLARAIWHYDQMHRAEERLPIGHLPDEPAPTLLAAEEGPLCLCKQMTERECINAWVPFPGCRLEGQR